MRRVHIVGRKNSGKTKLVLDLIEEFRDRGLRVGTIKHSPHEHSFDEPGTDSFKLREAGGDPSAFIAFNAMGVYMDRAPRDDPYRTLSSLFMKCDLVLVEGDVDAPGIKIEIWRRDSGAVSLASEGHDIAAMITDDEPDADVTVWSGKSIVQVAGNILKLTGLLMK